MTDEGTSTCSHRSFLSDTHHASEEFVRQVRELIVQPPEKSWIEQV